jgi:hypothetical protein
MEKVKTLGRKKAGNPENAKMHASEPPAMAVIHTIR